MARGCGSNAQRGTLSRRPEHTAIRPYDLGGDECVRSHSVIGVVVEKYCAGQSHRANESKATRAVALGIAVIPRICPIRACGGTWLSGANLAENIGKSSTIQGGSDYHGVMANKYPGVQQHTDNRQKTEQPTLHRDNPVIRITAARRHC